MQAKKTLWPCVSLSSYCKHTRALRDVWYGISTSHWLIECTIHMYTVYALVRIEDGWWELLLIYIVAVSFKNRVRVSMAKYAPRYGISCRDIQATAAVTYITFKSVHIFFLTVMSRHGTSRLFRYVSYVSLPRKSSNFAKSWMTFSSETPQHLHLH